MTQWWNNNWEYGNQTTAVEEKRGSICHLKLPKYAIWILLKIIFSWLGKTLLLPGLPRNMAIEQFVHCWDSEDFILWKVCNLRKHPETEIWTWISLAWELIYDTMCWIVRNFKYFDLQAMIIFKWKYFQMANKSQFCWSFIFDFLKDLKGFLVLKASMELITSNDDQDGYDDDSHCG